MSIIQHRCGGACGCHHSFLIEGCWVYPFSAHLRIPGETLGSIRAAADASSHSFLKVSRGTQCSGRSARSGGTTPEGVAVAGLVRSVNLPLLALLPLFFLMGMIVHLYPCGCYINIAGWKPFSRNVLVSRASPKKILFSISRGAGDSHHPKTTSNASSHLKGLSLFPFSFFPFSFFHFPFYIFFFFMFYAFCFFVSSFTLIYFLIYIFCFKIYFY
jgi:hypothetical protein